MWVWSKLSATKWEDAWEERFHGNPNAVLTRLKGGKSIRVDVYCEEENAAENIAEQFGGTVKQLADKNWVALSAEVGPPAGAAGSIATHANTTRQAIEARKYRMPRG